MKGALGIGAVIIGLLVIFGIFAFGQYNTLVGVEEDVNKAWANVESDYQRRYDLIDNLVATVDNAAEFERGTLTDVIEARSRAQSVQLSVDELTPENIQRFQQAQNELNQSFLGRMSFLQENYPQLTATQQFRDLMSQIEGTENRINVSRNRYNDAVQVYNTKVRSAPTNIIAGLFGFERKAPFTSVQGAEVAPSVRDSFNR